MYILIFILFLTYTQLDAGDAIRIIAGSEYETRIGDAAFRNLPQVPNCCPDFNTYTLNNLSFSIGLEWQRENYGLQLNINPKKIESSFESFQNDLINLDGKAIKGIYKHLMKFNYSQLSAELNAMYSYSRLKFLLGVGFSYYEDMDAYQAETIHEPADKGVFWDTKTRTRNEWSGIFKINGIVPKLIAKIEYPLQGNDRGNFSFVPFIKYQYGFRISDILNWKEDIISLGFAFKFDFNYQSIDTVRYTPKIKVNEPSKIPKYDFLISRIKNQKEIFGNSIDLRVENHIIEHNILNSNKLIKSLDTMRLIKSDFESLKISILNRNINEFEQIRIYLDSNQSNELEYQVVNNSILINKDEYENLFKDENNQLYIYLKPNNGNIYDQTISLSVEKTTQYAKNLITFESNAAGESEMSLIKVEILKLLSNKNRLRLITNNKQFGLELVKLVDSPNIQLISNESLISKDEYQYILTIEIE